MSKVLLDFETPAQQEKEMMQRLNALMVGQLRAKKRLIRLWMYANSQSGKLREREKPAGIIWLLGPSGVGKTYLAHALAKIIFGNSSALTNIDCTQYPSRYDISGLIGTKPGYVGFDGEPLLTQRSLDHWGFMLDCSKQQDKIKLFNEVFEKLDKIFSKLNVISKELRQPTTTSPRQKRIKKEERKLTQTKEQLLKEYNTLAAEVEYNPGGYPSILLFDEIEKAHRSFHNVLYQIFQDGRTTVHYQNRENNTNVEEVSFNNAFIILTSNVGEEEIEKEIEGRIPGFAPRRVDGGQNIYKRVMRELKQKFPPPFIRRVGKENIIICPALYKDDLRQALDSILVSELEASYIKTIPITLMLDESVKEYLVDEAYGIKSRSLGMSALQNVFKKHISEPLSILAAKSISEGGIVEGDSIIAELVVSKKNTKQVSLSRQKRTAQQNKKLTIKAGDNDGIRTFDIFHE